MDSPLLLSSRPDLPWRMLWLKSLPMFRQWLVICNKLLTSGSTDGFWLSWTPTVRTFSNFPCHVLITASQLLVNSNKAFDFVQGVVDLNGNFTNYAADETSCQVQIEQAMLGAALLSERRSSVWVFTDSDGPNDINYIQLFDVAQQYQISLNLVGYGSSICTAPENNGQFPYYLKSLSETTLGEVYMTDKLDQILLFIISLYKSAVSHRYYISDCTKPTSYYMPVDGWTQSLTLAVTGTDLNNVEVVFPDGTKGQHSDYEMVAINDPETKLNQYVAGTKEDSNSGRNLYFQLARDNTGTTDCKTATSSHLTSMLGLTLGMFATPRRLILSTLIMQIWTATSTVNKLFQLARSFCLCSLGQVRGYRVWIGLAFNNGKWYWDVPDNNVAQPLVRPK